ncbi:MAG: ISNCY family transposase [Dehalococcoidia bacterium]
MRTKHNTQPEFVFQLPPSAKITDDYFARYDFIASFLDGHREIVDRVHRDLRKPLAKAQRKGPQGQACSFSSDTVLRLCLVKILEGTTYRGTIVRVDDSPRLREFTRLFNGVVMSPATFNRLANAIRPATWKAINQLLTEAAVTEGLITGDQLRLDTTAVETNIHWPTDSGILWDVYRVLDRHVQAIRKRHSELVSDKRLHAKKAKRLHSRISRTTRHKTEKSKAERKRHYERLIALVEGILDWLPTLCVRVRCEIARSSLTVSDGLVLQSRVAEIEDVVPLGRQAVDQARRRVLLGEQVPNDEKLFSIFEHHTELLIRGKANKDIEFGHMINICQVESKFITDYEVFEKKPVEYELIEGALDSHKELFGKMPDVLAADKGYWEDAFTTERLRWKVPLVCIAKKGRSTEEERAYERSLPFRLGQAFRAGVEGSISFLKRMLGLWRCMNKGFDHFVSTVGASVFAHNLLILSRAPG